MYSSFRYFSETMTFTQESGIALTRWTLYNQGMKLLPALLELFWIFFKIGAVTFGGGLAMLPLLETELVSRRKWVSASTMVDYFAIGQSTPGVIAVNVATFVGYTRRGIPGALAATAGIVAPSLIIITLLAMFLNNFAEIAVVQRALRGINVIVAVLLIGACWDLGKKTLSDWYTVLISLAAFAAISFFNIPGVYVVLCSASLGLIAVFSGLARLDTTDGEQSE